MVRAVLCSSSISGLRLVLLRARVGCDEVLQRTAAPRSKGQGDPTADR